MTDIDLAAIRERCEQATPGPWITDPRYGQEGFIHFECDGDPQPASRVAMSEFKRDTEFIAHARADVPALLAIAERALDREALAEILHGDECTEDFDEDETCGCDGHRYYRLADALIRYLRGGSND